MKKALSMMLLGVMLSTVVATAAFAEYVYVTKFGKKYHHAESRFIQDRETEKITLEEAEDRGLEPSISYLKWKEADEEGEELSKAKKTKKK